MQCRNQCHPNNFLKSRVETAGSDDQTDRGADPRLRGRLRVHGARSARPLRSHLRVRVDGVGGGAAEEAGRALLGPGRRWGTGEIGMAMNCRVSVSLTRADNFSSLVDLLD